MVVGIRSGLLGLRKGYEKELYEKLETLKPPAKYGFVTDPFRDVGTSKIVTGRQRHLTLNKILDSFGLDRSKHQKFFHKEMTKAIIPYVYRDDIDAHIETLRKEFETDEFKQQVMIVTPRRWGKCLGPNVMIRMYNGTCTKACDIVTGDLVLGDDGEPRIVLNTIEGRDTMYRIQAQDASHEYTCNEGHLLVMSLQRAAGAKTVTFPVEKLYEHVLQHTGNGRRDGLLQVPEHVRGLRADGSTYRINIRKEGIGNFCGFQCASIINLYTDEAFDDLSQLLQKCHHYDDVYLDTIINSLTNIYLLPSLANGQIAENGSYPGRFVLSDGTVTHNTYSVAMFVAACALSIDSVDTPFTQSIFSPGRRPSQMLLELVGRFIKHVTGQKKAGFIENVEVIKLQGPCGPNDVRQIYSYPSVEKVRFYSNQSPCKTKKQQNNNYKYPSIPSNVTQHALHENILYTLQKCKNNTTSFG